MADVLMIAIMIGFILLCVAYVGWCDRIIGPDPEPVVAPADESGQSTETRVPAEVTS